MLKTLLQQNKAFKLVTGAGNENPQQVEKLVSIYAQAGCKFFDVCADINILKAAKQGVQKTGKDPSDVSFCVSVGIKGDPHIQKAKIDAALCSRCQKCFEICPQEAISQYLKVKEQNCIGCKKCFKVCRSSAISFYDKEKDLEQIIPKLMEEGIDCIELHANGENEGTIFEKWDYLNKTFDGFLSICIDRSKLNSEQFIKRIIKALEYRKPYTTIIQADGNPMSGSNNDYKTTLEAIATSKIVQDENLPAYILISGGTNAKTMELAKLCEVKANGVALGSYARKIVKNKDYKTALEQAKELVSTITPLD